tara:strand:- start:222 stop:899 length:678 start_codon:yes stop_codon:yes gene_type:complete
MLLLQPDDGPATEFSLKERNTKGSHAESLKGKVVLSKPTVLNLEQRLIGDDQLLEAEVNQMKNKYHYFFVALSCSFAPAQNERFESAEVSITLQSDDTSLPSVHSMRPAQMVDTETLTKSAKIGADLCFISELSRVQEVEKKHLFLSTFLANRKAYWLFTHTNASNILGTFPLQLIVKLPVTSVGFRGEVNMSIRVGKKRFYLFWQKNHVNHHAPITFRGEVDNE